MPVNNRLVISQVLLTDVSPGSSSSMGFIDHIFFRTSYMFPYSVATLLGIYFLIICTVSPCHDWNYTLIYVDLTGMNGAAFRYLTKSVWFFMWYALLILCSGFFPIF